MFLVVPYDPRKGDYDWMCEAAKEPVRIEDITVVVVVGDGHITIC